MAIEVPCLLNSAVSTINQHRSLYQASHTTLTCVQVRLARIGHIAIDEAATLPTTRNAMCSCGMGTCMYKILMLYLLDDSCSGSVFFFPSSLLSLLWCDGTMQACQEARIKR
jgi:hypothetical protein